MSKGSLADNLLDSLKAEQQQFALESLHRPQTRDAFEYGYRVGVVAGYDASIKLLLDLLNEEEYGDNDL
jgi:hypothetical protein